MIFSSLTVNRRPCATCLNQPQNHRIILPQSNFLLLSYQGDHHHRDMMHQLAACSMHHASMRGCLNHFLLHTSFPNHFLSLIAPPSFQTTFANRDRYVAKTNQTVYRPLRIGNPHQAWPSSLHLFQNFAEHDHLDAIISWKVCQVPNPWCSPLRKSRYLFQQYTTSTQFLDTVLNLATACWRELLLRTVHISLSCCLSRSL